MACVPASQEEQLINNHIHNPRDPHLALEEDEDVYCASCKGCGYDEGGVFRIYSGSGGIVGGDGHQEVGVNVLAEFSEIVLVG
ncbi:predicted protein [Pyrenophora tritici-repentis Pt-1C-BFP]|uniref:Uncharacterized protein n=1 Tax=Pyrenophora tritici-repentis (strain Pt-1C-BFP) TaxID=426418 RepID=B2WKD4_PYRTR|nr:uncharacterized protein PTRG_10444 [Pyrenophora tritici-repentis Pt-1C-BFP]EDU43494.1 predicted protein [Pyrenophora tritici-repentis Pt-1C-BFP]